MLYSAAAAIVDDATFLSGKILQSRYKTWHVKTKQRTAEMIWQSEFERPPRKIAEDSGTKGALRVPISKEKQELYLACQKDGVFTGPLLGQKGQFPVGDMQFLRHPSIFQNSIYYLKSTAELQAFIICILKITYVYTLYVIIYYS